MRWNQTLIDSHAHVQFPVYDPDRDAVLQRAIEGGIGVINVGTQYSTSEDAVRLAEQHGEGVWATVGFHPNHVDLGAHHDPWELRDQHREPFAISKFRTFAAHPKVVAIGECGFDYYRIQNLESKTQNRQWEVFVQQIELAAEVKKPLVVHCRKAFTDLVRILNSRFQILNSPAGVVHFFSGTWADAKKLLELGFYVSFGGVITFARDYDEVVKKAPLDRLLVETDAPYVAPVPYRGKRNEPVYIIETVRKIAELRGIEFEVVAASTTENTKTLFRL